MYTEKIIISLTPKQKEIIKLKANEYGLTITQLVRSSLNRYFIEFLTEPKTKKNEQI